MTIIGYGGIGKAIAKIAFCGFGMEIIAVKRNIENWSDEYVKGAFTMDKI